MNAKRSNKIILTLTQSEADKIVEELSDFGFDADDMSGKKQPNQKWPTLFELYEELGY